MENKNDKEKTTFQKLWENPQSKAGIKLLLYFIFIAFVVLMINTASNTHVLNVNEKPKVTIQNMKDQLLSKNFQYEYIVVDNDGIKTIYKGNKTNNINEGTRETVEKITKYYIDKSGIYETVLGEKKVMTSLYENIDEKFLDVKYVLDLVKDKTTAITTRDGHKEYNYMFLIENNGCEIIIRTDNKQINNIYINYKDYVYDLNFSNIEN